MRKLLLFAFAIFLTGSMMAQSAVTIDPPNATAWDEITLYLDVSMSCPDSALLEADTIAMHSGVTIDGVAWSNAVPFDGMGANEQLPYLTKVVAMPYALTMEPADATAWDEVTLTLDANFSCPEGALLDADSVMMHSGVTLDGAVWSNVVNFDAVGANGMAPKFASNGDGTWSMTFIPAEFYGLEDGANVTAINCVFNNGTWDAEGKAFDEEGNCTDFVVEFGGGGVSLEGTWMIPAEVGAIGVGPNQGDISWWSNTEEDLTTRACYFNDEYVFGGDGSFQNVLGDETWLEVWQGMDPEGCGTPVYPHDGSNAATFTFDEGAGTLMLDGVGAFLGLPKAFNGGELTDPNDAPESITYTVSFSEGGTRMIVDLDIGGGWWRYNLVKQAPAREESTIWMITFTPADYYGIEEGANVEAIDCVFNGGAWENGEAKDFDGEGNCVDFKITLGGGGDEMVIADFEDGTAGPLTLHVMGCGDWDNEELHAVEETFTVIDNPDPSGMNTSAKVMQFNRRGLDEGGQPWGGFWANVDPNLDVTTHKYVHVMVWKPRISPVKFKLEGGPSGTLEVESSNEQADAETWVDMVFDFSEMDGAYPVVAFMPDYEDPFTAEELQIIYFDNIRVNSDPNPYDDTGIEDEVNGTSAISVFPNPCNTTLNVAVSENLQRFEIYNMLGQVQMTFSEVNPGTLTINTADLPKGIYLIVTLDEQNNRGTAKFIKE
jgi:hypothetical protein